MKYTLVALLAICLFVSCKKTRTCNCTINRSGTVTTTSESAGLTISIPGLPAIPGLPGSTANSSENYNITTTEVSKFDKVSKGDMHSACAKHREEMIYDRKVAMSAGQYTTTTIDSGMKTTDCTIKD
jgi:hypothetical protein